MSSNTIDRAPGSNAAPAGDTQAGHGHHAHAHDDACGCGHDHHHHHGHHHHAPVVTYQRSMPKIGRNDACVCGSGKKYKKCCMAKLEG